MCASVKTTCREKTCLAFALSRAQRVCNCAPQNVLIVQSLQELWSQAACIPFELITFSLYFEKFSFQYLILFIYFAMSAFSSFSESSKYVQKPITWHGRNSICSCSCLNILARVLKDSVIASVILITFFSCKFVPHS